MSRLFGRTGIVSTTPTFDKTSLISWWDLEETSGIRNDAHGTNHLTDNNTVGYAAGKVGNAADFEVDNSESLSIYSNSSLQAGDIDITFGLWVKFESWGTYPRLLDKDGSVSREYFFFYYNDFTAFGWGIPAGDLLVSSLSPLSLGTWYFVLFWHDATANTMNIQVNNGTVDSKSHSGGIPAGEASFSLGGSQVFGGYFDGLLDSVFLIKRVLTVDERTWLYNSGAGRAYSEL